MRDIQKLISSLTVPAVHAVAVKSPSRSHLGGRPHLPATIEWPKWQERYLDFLARISLPEVHQTHEIYWLPKDGALLFFYDNEEQPWGFDPKERGSTVVLHVPDVEEPFPAKFKSSEDQPFAHVNLGFKSIETLPSSLRSQVKTLNLTDEEKKEYWKFLDTLHGDLPKHQVGGFPARIQGDEMELECQLATNGLFAGESGYVDPRADQLAAGAADWRLLFQLDSTSNPDFVWGDTGRLYFWVREQDAKTGRFDNVWTILQCF